MATDRKSKTVGPLPKSVLEKKPGIELFLKRIPTGSLPKRGSTLPTLDFIGSKKFQGILDHLQHELEETEVMIYKARLERLGLSLMDMKKLTARRKAVQKKFLKSINEQFKSFAVQRADQRFDGVITDNSPFALFCKEFTVNVCQRKVCVDQPVPLNVDDIWVEPNTQGSFNMLTLSTFSHEDEANGYSDWNWTYHRYSRTHEGGINVRSGVELVEQSKIRQIGISFQPLIDHRGWPRENGVFAIGDDPAALPPSWGQGKMWISFQVSIKVPDGPWVRQIPDASVMVLYKDTGRIENRITQSYAYPPTRTLDLNTVYPAGTQILVEVQLSYWINGNGDGGNAWADYNLEVLPYMNLEACTWEYPAWVCVPVP